MGKIIKAWQRMNHNPGMTAREALDWAEKQPKGGSWVSTIGTRVAEIALAVWTVAHHHKTKGKH